VFGGKLDWGPEAIVRDDPNFQGHGNPSSGNVSFPGVVVPWKYYVPQSILTLVVRQVSRKVFAKVETPLDFMQLADDLMASVHKNC
jgi:hypothetical protein